jgi:hypothetical protein
MAPSAPTKESVRIKAEGLSELYDGNKGDKEAKVE